MKGVIFSLGSLWIRSCRYDHLTEVLAKILAERPKNVVDFFEEYSRRVKEERFKASANHIRDLYVPPARYENAKKIIELFKVRLRSNLWFGRRINKARRVRKRNLFPHFAFTYSCWNRRPFSRSMRRIRWSPRKLARRTKTRGWETRNRIWWSFCPISNRLT